MDTRKVDNVNEISLHGTKYIVPPYKNLSLAGSTVEIRENPYKWFKIFYNGHCLKKYSREAHDDKTIY